MNYIKLYESIINNRKINPPTDNIERHHIIPKCMGGHNRMDNIVPLTTREHFICHYLLTKIHPENKKLLFAFMCMTVPTSEENIIIRYFNSRLYSYFRKRHAEKIRDWPKDIGTGRKYIHNVILNINKKIPNDIPVPDGWKLGRIINYPNKSKWIYNENSNKYSRIEQDAEIPSGWKKCKTPNKLNGSKNPQYGKMWIYNDTLKQSKTIPKTDNIPEGWNRGRKQIF